MSNIEYKYIVIISRVTGSDFKVVYYWDGESFNTLKKAIKHGFTLDKSDDFNIGIVKGSTLVQLNWMDKDIGEDKEVLKEIEKEIELEYIKQ